MTTLCVLCRALCRLTLSLLAYSHDPVLRQLAPLVAAKVCEGFDAHQTLQLDGPTASRSNARPVHCSAPGGWV